jgi:4-hydroxyphenylpyruvate dioxygenase
MPHRPAIASMSLGRASVHKLPNKLDQAAKHGFEGIELFFEDLEQFSRELEGGTTPENLIETAREIHRLCADRNLQIICLQPFMHYEGLKDREQHARRIEQLKLWLMLAKALGTDVIQIPSSFLHQDDLIRDPDAMVRDLREAADLGLQESPVIRFAYESLAWGTYVDTWEKCWDIVSLVDRPNFGICLDSFNIAATVFADPAAQTGKTPNSDADIKASIARLGKTVDRKKVFFVQIVDAERLERPLVKGHEFYNPDQPPRLSWSRNCRLFYGEEERGGYLPIRDLANAFLNDTGYEGWWSLELFNRVMAEKDPNIPAQLATRGARSWQKLKKDLHMKDGNVPNGVNRVY